MFLSVKHRFFRKSVKNPSFGKTVITGNTMNRYPLKLPSTLTHLKESRASKLSYGDAAFTDAYGDPVVEPNQHVFMFALGEKRFKNRKPFPIISNG